MALDLTGLNNLVNTIGGISNSAQNLVKSVTPIVSVLKPSVNTAKPAPVVSSSGNVFNSTIGAGAPIKLPIIVAPASTIPTSNLKWYLIGGGVALVIIAVVFIYLKKK
jgi:hypothetical protein